MLLANQISVFFNCQYLINGLISDFDFFNVDGHNERKRVYSQFQNKIISQANRSCWARKWSVLISLDLLYGFLKFFSQ